MKKEQTLNYISSFLKGRGIAQKIKFYAISGYKKIMKKHIFKMQEKNNIVDSTSHKDLEA